MVNSSSSKVFPRPWTAETLKKPSTGKLGSFWTTKFVGTFERDTAKSSPKPPGLLIWIEVLFKKSKASCVIEWISTYRESPFANGDLRSPFSSESNLVIPLLIGGINGMPSISAPSDEAPASSTVSDMGVAN